MLRHATTLFPMVANVPYAGRVTVIVKLYRS